MIFFLSPRRVLPLLAWGDFHARSRFARPTIPEEKWGTTRSLSLEKSTEQSQTRWHSNPPQINDRKCMEPAQKVRLLASSGWSRHPSPTHHR